MTGTAPRAMSLETHTRQLIGPEKRVRRTALLEKRTVWCGFAPSEKHNGHMIKSLLTELDRARRALGPYVLTSSQIVSLTGLPLSQ